MKIKLPKPRIDSHISIAQSLAGRRSARQFSNEPLNLHEISLYILPVGKHRA
jgi:hypothetical protein